MSNKNNNYDVTSLTSLEKLEPVRVRPGMYIGSTGSNWSFVGQVDHP